MEPFWILTSVPNEGLTEGDDISKPPAVPSPVIPPACAIGADEPFAMSFFGRYEPQRIPKGILRVPLGGKRSLPIDPPSKGSPMEALTRHMDLHWTPLGRSR